MSVGSAIVLGIVSGGMVYSFFCDIIINALTHLPDPKFANFCCLFFSILVAFAVASGVFAFTGHQYPE